MPIFFLNSEPVWRWRRRHETELRLSSILTAGNRRTNYMNNNSRLSAKGRLCQQNAKCFNVKKDASYIR